MASAFWLASETAPVLSPCTVRSRMRWVTFIICSSDELPWSSQVLASATLRPCWATAACSARVCIALFVPVGESDGLLMSLPEVSWFWSLPSVSRLRLRPCRLVSVTARCVMRTQITAPRGRCG